jgi:hypothetical protein
LHYAIALAPTPYIKPDGTPYENNDDDWGWLEAAAKAARWLGHIGFDQIFDKRNATPVVRLAPSPSDPWPFLRVGIDVKIPDAANINPTVGLANFSAAQPYRIVFIGEKASLDEGLTPVARECGADLYLPTGNISDTLVHQIAKNGAEDGRPMVVLYFSDCDMSGWNMPIEVGRKLQAFKALLYPDLEFRQYRALLTPNQVLERNLPQGPLKRHPKDANKYADARAEEWIAEMGVTQTEVDVLTIPDMVATLRAMARDAVAPFWDRTLHSREIEVRQAWVTAAQEVVDDSTDQELLERLRTDAAEALESLAAEVEAINEAAQVDADDFDLPEIPEIPEPVIDDDQPMPLLDSAWSFADQTQALIDSKAYRS